MVEHSRALGESGRWSEAMTFDIPERVPPEGVPSNEDPDVRIHTSDPTSRAIPDVDPEPFATLGIRRFVLNRVEDVTGTSGTGIIAEGVRFSDGTVVIRWVVSLRSTAIYHSVDDLVAIHGHDGATVVVWADPC